MSDGGIMRAINWPRIVGTGNKVDCESLLASPADASSSSLCIRTKTTAVNTIIIVHPRQNSQIRRTDNAVLLLKRFALRIRVVPCLCLVDRLGLRAPRPRVGNISSKSSSSGAMRLCRGSRGIGEVGGCNGNGLAGGHRTARKRPTPTRGAALVGAASGSYDSSHQ